MLAKLSKIKYITRKILLRLFHYIENNNNCNFKTNGEALFLNDLLNYIKSDNEGIVIFDVGANVGDYSSMLIDKANDIGMGFCIHAFEPTESCFKLLSEKFSGNKSIILNKFGLSDNSSQVVIYYDEEKSGLASLYKRDLSSINIEFSQMESIEVIRCDKYIQDKGISHINFIKMDIEGHEYKALSGLGEYLSSDFIDFIQFEYGGANLDSHTGLADIYSLLEPQGFVICKILRNGLEIRRFESFMENYNFSNYVAVSKSIMERLG